MIPNLEVIRLALVGTWRLFLDAPDAHRYFDKSVNGFWQSFFAIVICIPMVVYIYFVQPVFGALQVQTSMGDLNSVFTAPPPLPFALQYAFSWIAFPVAMIPFSRVFDLSQNYIAYIVAFNWANVLTAAAGAFYFFMIRSGFIGVGGAGLLGLFLFVMLVRLEYLIAQRMLVASSLLAVGVIVFQAGVSLIVALVSSVLFPAF